MIKRLDPLNPLSAGNGRRNVINSDMLDEAINLINPLNPGLKQFHVST